MLKKWAKATLIRCIKTFAEGMLAFIGANAVTIGEVDWIASLYAGLFAAIICFLTCIKGLPEANDGESPLTLTEIQ